MTIRTQVRFECDAPECDIVCMTERILYDFPRIPSIPSLPQGWTMVKNIPICPNHTITLDGKEIGY